MNTLTQLLTEHGHEDLLPRLGTMSTTEVDTMDREATQLLRIQRPSMVAQRLAKRIDTMRLVHIEVAEPKDDNDGLCTRCLRHAEPGYRLCIDCAYTRGE